MKNSQLLLPMLILTLGLTLSTTGHSEKQTDPDWPCMQRKVPSISLAQVWRGPAIAAPAGNWNDDPATRGAVIALLDRRVTTAEAVTRAVAHMRLLAPDARPQATSLLVTGLLERTNAERSQIIDGISRYAHRQAALAQDVRKEAVKLSELRQKPDIDAMELERSTQQFQIAARVFQDRAQSLRYVCDVPVQLEQRLFAVLEAIRKESTK